jgi:putative transposase
MLWAGRLDKNMATRKRHSPAISEQTYYRWRSQFGGLKADDAKRLKDLERENATRKRLLADAELEKAALKEIARGTF